MLQSQLWKKGGQLRMPTSEAVERKVKDGIHKRWGQIEIEPGETCNSALDI